MNFQLKKLFSSYEDEKSEKIEKFFYSTSSWCGVLMTDNLAQQTEKMLL